MSLVDKLLVGRGTLEFCCTVGQVPQICRFAEEGMTLIFHAQILIG